MRLKALLLTTVATMLLAGCNQQQGGNQVAGGKQTNAPEFYATLYRVTERDAEAAWELKHPSLIDKSSAKEKALFIEKVNKIQGFGRTYCDKPSYFLEVPPIYDGEYAHVKQSTKCGNVLMRTTTINLHKYEGKWYQIGNSDGTTYIDTKAGKLTAGK